ncbi:MAG: class I SAM-dependent methyltransferase, partial [Gammaproteobacteria bacterium]|nr:class I SAM-dependent methyltransferase [Gammaproteobacteria bacterium]
MADWSGGYVTEVSYPYSYRSDMNPVRIRALLTLAGYEMPTGSIVCELGFGQGVAINVHACTQPDSLYVGTDFSPTQTGFAQTLQQQTGAEMLLVDESFEQFCQREDLPSFDFIVAHGIWSWVSEENRRWIEHFVAKRLKVGGAFVFSYNALPGWSVFAPVRDFMLHYADKALPSSAPITDKLNAAMRQVERMGAIPAHLSLLQ